MVGQVCMLLSDVESNLNTHKPFTHSKEEAVGLLMIGNTRSAHNIMNIISHSDSVLIGNVTLKVHVVHYRVQFQKQPLN